MPIQESLLSIFTPIILFIFLYASLYTILLKMKFFGDSKSIVASIAFAVTLLMIIIPEVRQVTMLYMPWVMMFAFMVLTIFIVFMFLGVKESALVKVATENSAFLTITIALLIILFLVALTQVYGPFLMVNESAGFWNSFKRIIFHPRVLGVLFILIVASYTIRYLGEK